MIRGENMAAISFSKGEAWVVARWAYCRLFSDILDRFSVDKDIQYTIEQAVALDGISFRLLGNSKFEILFMMKATIIELVDDEIGAYRKSLDEKGYKMYREALPELLKYIEEYEEKEKEPE